MKTLLILLAILAILVIAMFVFDALAKKNEGWNFFNVLTQVVFVFYTFGTLWYLFG